MLLLLSGSTVIVCRHDKVAQNGCTKSRCPSVSRITGSSLRRVISKMDLRNGKTAVTQLLILAGHRVPLSASESARCESRPVMVTNLCLVVFVIGVFSSM